MDNKMTIASFGGSLKVYDVQNHKLVETAEYKSGRTSNCNHITWAANGKWIVGPIEESGILPILKYEKDKLTRMRNIIDPDMSAVAFFNYTNKDVIVGSKNGAINLWSVKEKKINKQICSKDTKDIKIIDVSNDDIYIAACGSYSTQPTIKIYGVTTNKLTNTLELDNPCEISDMKFSSIRVNFLGCSTMEGEVTIFDLYKNVPIMNIKEAHTGTCTGFAMSPINYYVAASVSLSQTLVIHDVRSRTAALRVPVGERLTAVDLLRAEPYAFMGTRDGRLILLDLRTAKAVDSVQAFDKEVESVRVLLDHKVGSQFKDIAVNTPDEPITISYPLEMSVADICTPPMLANHIRKSGLRKSIGMNDTKSPYSGRYQSTPNMGNLSQDSFMKLIESPQPCSVPPSPIDYDAPHLNLSLSKIKEESKDESVKQVNADEELEVVPVTQPLQLPNEFLPLVREMIKEEMKEVRSEISDMRQEIKTMSENMSTMMQRNRDIMFRLMTDVECLQYVIPCQLKLSNFDFRNGDHIEDS